MPSELEIAPPSSSPGPPPGTDSTPNSGAKSSTGKATYEATRSTGNTAQRSPRPLNRGSLLAQANSLTPKPTPGSAQGPGELADSIAASAGLSELDNLPPLDLPTARTSADSSTPPAPTPTDSEPAPAVPPAPTLTVANEAPTSAAPGIQRFAGVESKLAGGSLPDAAGLRWLFEKGYRTILDLRENSQASSAFIADVDRIGLRYVALPISLKTLDSNHISRFHDELSQAGARPLYFCDADGTRAGALWYIHKITVDHVDPQVARREAEEIGLKDQAFWDAITAYLERTKTTTASRPVAMTEPAPVPEKKPEPPAPTPAAEANKDDGSNAPPAPTAGPSPADTEARNDPQPRDGGAANWRPLTALLVTGVAAPLAYFSTGAIPMGFRALARASLPGPARTPKSLPG